MQERKRKRTGAAERYLSMAGLFWWRLASPYWCASEFLGMFLDNCYSSFYWIAAD
jgi:hypothetical protein